MLLFCSLEVVSEVAVTSSYQKKMRAIQLPAKDNVAKGTPETMARATQVCSESRLSILSTTLTYLPQVHIFSQSPYTHHSLVTSG